MCSLADTIKIISLIDVVSDWQDESNLAFYNDSYHHEGFVPLQLALNYYHKDNISCGSAYSLKITSEQSIDSIFLNEEHDTTFINYLKICFDNCGFSRIANTDSGNDFQEFFERVKPQLKQI